MNRVLATFGTGPAAEMLRLILPGFEAYAARHGYDVHVGDGFSDGRPPSWGKIPLFLSLFDRYDEILWIDSDVVIADSTDDLAADVPARAIQAMVVHRRHFPAQRRWSIIPNCGIWYLRPQMRPWLQRAWEMTQFIDHPWWEQAAMMQLLGYRIDGKIGIPPDEPTELGTMTHNLDVAWNYHPIFAGGNRKTPRFWHAMGYPTLKHSLIADWVRGKNLVSTNEEWNERMSQRNNERFIAAYVRGRPGALYDLGVGPKTEWQTLRDQWPGLQMFGAEPFPPTYIDLQPRFTGPLWPVAIADPGEFGRVVELRGDPDDAKTASILRQPHKLNVQVPVWTLDEFDAAAGKPDRILLWMDIEGCELSALRSGPELLASRRVKWINLEERRSPTRVAPGWPTAVEIRDFIVAAGYVRKRAYNHHPTHQDAIYVLPE